jgi:hypothetical protein
MMWQNWSPLAKLVKKILSKQRPSTTFVVNHHIMASPAMGHRYHWQVNPSARQLHLHRCSSRILYEVGRGEASHQCKLSNNQKIFWQKIICRCGVPWHIIVNNAKYFDSAVFKDFCQQIRMKVAFPSMYHHQSNGAGERANTLIFEAI